MSVVSTQNDDEYQPGGLVRRLSILAALDNPDEASELSRRGKRSTNNGSLASPEPEK